jgi:hypothetical protein
MPRLAISSLVLLALTTGGICIAETQNQTQSAESAPQLNWTALLEPELGELPSTYIANVVLVSGLNDMLRGLNGNASSSLKIARDGTGTNGTGAGPAEKPFMTAGGTYDVTPFYPSSRTSTNMVLQNIRLARWLIRKLHRKDSYQGRRQFLEG